VVPKQTIPEWAVSSDLCSYKQPDTHQGMGTQNKKAMDEQIET
jgi:hypothetical protein